MLDLGDRTWTLEEGGIIDSDDVNGIRDEGGNSAIEVFGWVRGDGDVAGGAHAS